MGHPRPAQLHHAGTVQTTALWVANEPLGHQVARMRAWHRWVPGMRVDRVPDGLLLRLPVAATIDCRATSEVPLMDVAGRWCAAPLRPSDVADFEAGTVLRFEAGTLVAHPPHTFEPVDLAAWLDVDGFELWPVSPLGPPPAPPVVAAAPIQTVSPERLGIGPLDPRRTEVAGTLHTEGTGSWFKGLGHRAFGWVTGTLARGARRVADAQPPAVARPVASVANWLDEVAKRLGLQGALARVMGEQHLRYLRRMMSLFDEGDWADALRHAIPLSGKPSVGEDGGRPGWLRPSAGLTHRGPGSSGPSLGLGSGLFGMLEQMYQRAHRALDEQGRIKEAAYVLSELLGKPQEAVLYLEKHDAHALAAELAEANELDAGLVVLLWLRAEDFERALAIARTRDAFAAAHAGLLERNLVKEMRGLRRVWAEHEAKSGRYAAAAEILWPLEDQRPRAVQWLQQAMFTPGIAGAHALMRHALSCPEARDLTEEALRNLVAAEGKEGVSARTAALDLLSTPAVVATVGSLLRPLSRALVVDAAEQPSIMAAKRARRLAAAVDPAMAADLPILPVAGVDGSIPLLPAHLPLELRIHAGDVGTTPIFDAVDLPGGRWLLALGEAGVRVVDPTGTTLHAHLTPAHHLVATRDRTRAIVVGRRGSVVRLARFDGFTNQVEPWTDAAIDTFCSTFDGSVWFVAHGDRLMGLDAQHATLRALWSTSEVGIASPDTAAVHDLHLSAERLWAMARASSTEVEVFEYRLSNLTLASRTRHVHGGEPLIACAPERSVSLGRLLQWEDDTVRTLTRDAISIDADGPLLAVSMKPNADLPASVEIWSHNDFVGSLAHEGAHAVRPRFTPDLLICTDDRGRLRAIDRQDRSIRADIRL